MAQSGLRAWHPGQKPASTLPSCSRAWETRYLSDRVLRSAPADGWANGKRFWNVLLWKAGEQRTALPTPSLMPTPCDAPPNPVRGQPERLVPTRGHGEDPTQVRSALVVSVLPDGTLTPLSLSFLFHKVGTLSAFPWGSPLGTCPTSSASSAVTAPGSGSESQTPAVLDGSHAHTPLPAA